MSEHLNKIPKETLTIQNIKQDIKELYKPSISIFFVFGILGAIFLLLAGEFWDETKITSTFVGVAGVTMIVGGAVNITSPLIGRRIANKKLVIVEDWLVDIREDIGYYNYRHRNPCHEFCFAKGGKYRIYLHTAASFENRHYKWSKMYNMSNQGIYNYSHIDDDFYLVFSNDKKNNLLLIYNKKLFDLKEN